MKKVILFSSPTCAPCKVVKPALLELAEERGFEVNVVDMALANKDVFLTYGVRSVPVIVCVDSDTDGDIEIGRVLGPMTHSALENTLDMWGLI